MFANTAAIISEGLIGRGTDRYAVDRSARVGPEGKGGGGDIRVGEIRSSRLESVNAEARRGLNGCPVGYQGIGEDEFERA